MKELCVRRLRTVFLNKVSRDWKSLTGLELVASGVSNKTLAISPYLRRVTALSESQENCLTHINSVHWTPVENLIRQSFAREDVDELVRAGVACYNEDVLGSAFLQSLEARVVQVGWNELSFLVHRLNGWEDIHLQLGDYGRLDDEGHFCPNPQDPKSILPSLPQAPTHFHRHSTEDEAVLRLPLPYLSGPVWNALRMRRTRRAFVDTSIASEKLASLLYGTFGWLAQRRVMDTLTVVRKASPSGGCLHPTECYPLVIRVDGIVPGIYHYRAEDHSLEFLKQMDERATEGLAQELACGQYWVRGANVFFILTSRFERNFWKYSDHAKSYPVCWLDIGHLSQTIYLLAAELGLAAAFGAALADVNANRALGLDGVSHGAMAFVACGVPKEEFVPNLEPVFQDRTE